MVGWLFRFFASICFFIVQAICALFTLHYHWKNPVRCPPITDPILFYPATELAEKIRKREVSCEAIIRAYINRIKAVNPIINAVVEDRFALAIKEAKGTDQMLFDTKMTTEELATKFPLLGIPVTVKESIALEGASHCSGRILPEKRVANKDADAVRLCKEAGAIPLLVSNTPELCMNFETFNNVTGTTCNPYDTRRTPGGSSGGEAALLASAASLIGIGSDLCGSIRLPPCFCGIWGHKPSPGIISNKGHYPDCQDKEVWRQVLHVGPMTRYASDLKLLLNVMLEKEAIPLLQPAVNIRNIKFYYMENNGGSILTRTVHSDITNAMGRLVDYLRNIGCKVNKLHVDDLQYSAELAFIKFFSIDGIDNLFGNNGEGAFLELAKFLTFRSNSVFPPILYGILRRFTQMFLQKPLISYSHMKLTQIKGKLVETLSPEGVLLYPTHPSVAGFHGQNNGKAADYGYMAIFSCLGFPVTNCPLGLNSEGLPVGIQVIAAPNNDRLTIAVAQEIEKKFGGWIPPVFSDIEEK